MHSPDGGKRGGANAASTLAPLVMQVVKPQTYLANTMQTQVEEEYVSLRLAHGDISHAITLLNLAQTEKDPTIKAVIVRDCIIKYVKPFKVSYGVFQRSFKALKKEEIFPDGNPDHDALVSERDQRIAHGDITACKPKLHYWTKQNIFPIVFRSSHLYDDIDTLIERVLSLCNIVLDYLNNRMESLENSFRDAIRKDQVKPIILVLGLSGVGKNYASDMLAAEYSFLHKDMDRRDHKHAFEHAGLPPEWDKNILLVDFSIFADGIRRDLENSHQGAVVSFPTTCLFNHEQLNGASYEGVGTVLLWGALEHCWNARRERQFKRTMNPPNYIDYISKNLPTFQMYKCSDYDVYRVVNFEEDESRPASDVLLKRMLDSLSKQGLQLSSPPI